MTFESICDDFGRYLRSVGYVVLMTIIYVKVCMILTDSGIGGKHEEKGVCVW